MDFTMINPRIMDVGELMKVDQEALASRDGENDDFEERTEKWTGLCFTAKSLLPGHGHSELHHMCIEVHDIRVQTRQLQCGSAIVQYWSDMKKDRNYHNFNNETKIDKLAAFMIDKKEERTSLSKLGASRLTRKE
eukprot:10128267-Heterocapsa_arctica.AAC.1